jgi:hypothetical protein
VIYPCQDTCLGKDDCSFEGTDRGGYESSSCDALPFLQQKKLSVPDTSGIAKDFTNAKSEILKELFNFAIRCFLIFHNKYYSLIE